ncbi:hypothetical protein FRB90_008438, partial [Tulasnella sp. 427]
MIPFTHRLVPVPGQDSGPESWRAEWRNQQAGPTSFETLGRKAFESLQERWRTSQPADGPSGSDTTIFPVIQSGVLGVREEEMVIDKLFNCVSKSNVPATVDLTSGYFGLYAPYKTRILESPDSIRWRIVAAAPKANGFYGSKGISGRLPEAYTWLERQFWGAASKAGKISSSDGKVELSEWEREGWTYHAKGIWVRFGEEGPSNDDGGKPAISLFGSTNLNSRSANLDTELSFMMVTSSRELSASLAEEVDGIRQNASVVGTTAKSQLARSRSPIMSTSAQPAMTNNNNVAPGAGYNEKGAGRGGFTKGFTFGGWFKLHAFDLLIMLFMGMLGLGIYFAKPAPTRNFPITFSDGEIVYPQYAYPLRRNIIPIWLAAVLAFIIPFFFFCLFQIRRRSLNDLMTTTMGLIQSLETAAVFQVFLKWLIGGFRPHFLAVCKPNVQGPGSGTGYQQIYYTRDVCTGDEKEINDSLESFPSGHSTAAFAGFVYLFFYFNAQLKVNSDHRPAYWKIVLT